MCECASTPIIDCTTGDTICTNCGHVSREHDSFGDFCDPWSLEADHNTGTVESRSAINMSNVYVSVCSTIASYFGLSTKERIRFFKKCAQKSATMHKPMNVALAVLYKINAKLFEDLDFSVFNTTKQSVWKLI